MTPLLYLGLAVAICLVGTIVVMATSRKPRQGPQDSIDAFNHQLEVLGRFVDRRADDGRRRSRRRWGSR